MIVRHLSEIVGSNRDVAWGNGESRRFLLAEDGLGYSITDTIINAESVSKLKYSHHLEACYCIEGIGELEDAHGQVHTIRPGTMYALDQNECHVLKAKTTMRLVCVFSPALEGKETHLGSLCDSSVSTYPPQET